MYASEGTLLRYVTCYRGRRHEWHHETRAVNMSKYNIQTYFKICCFNLILCRDKDNVSLSRWFSQTWGQVRKVVWRNLCVAPTVWSAASVFSFRCRGFFRKCFFLTDQMWYRLNIQGVFNVSGVFVTSERNYVLLSSGQSRCRTRTTVQMSIC